MPKEKEQSPTVYFAGEVHLDRVGRSREREIAKLKAMGAVDMHETISEAIGVLHGVCAFFLSLGLKAIAIEALKQTLILVRKGPSQ